MDPPTRIVEVAESATTVCTPGTSRSLAVTSRTRGGAFRTAGWAALAARFRVLRVIHSCFAGVGGGGTRVLLGGLSGACRGPGGGGGGVGDYGPAATVSVGRLCWRPHPGISPGTHMRPAASAGRMCVTFGGSDRHGVAVVRLVGDGFRDGFGDGFGDGFSDVFGDGL